MRIYKREELTLGNLAATQAKAHASKTFLQTKDAEITFGQFDELVNRTANGFARQGVKRGDHVSLMLPNSLEILYSIFGLAKLGAVAVPVNTAYKGDLLEHILKSSDSSMLVVEDEWVERVAFVENHLPGLKQVFVRTTNGSATTKPTGLEKPMANFKTLLDSPHAAPDVTVLHSEPQSLMYTSGTTGPSKGVEISQAHAPTTGLAFAQFMGFEEKDSIYSPMPLFHLIGFGQGVCGSLMNGSRIVISERFSASGWWNDIRKYNVSIGMGIFAMVPILMNQPPSPDDKKHPMRAFYLGPSALDKAMQERFGVRCVEIYGSSETGIPIMPGSYNESRPGACGRVRDDYYEVKIFDEFDRELPPGEPGEIVVRPKVPFGLFLGYYNFDSATVKAWRNLWFHTGDRAYKDKDGWFFFVDRVKDAVRRRGENVSSFEVERVLNAHPAVMETAIIAVPSEISEDEIKACVVLKPGAHVSPEELLDFCQPRMAHFMVPRFIEFMSALPKTPTDKVEKYKLRAEGNKGITPQTWDREKVGYKVKR